MNNNNGKAAGRIRHVVLARAFARVRDSTAGLRAALGPGPAGSAAPADTPTAPGWAGESPDRQVAAQQVRLLFDNAGTGTAATVAVGMALVGVFWSQAPLARLLSWLAVLLLISLWRLQLVERFRAAQPTGARLLAWRRTYLSGALASGLSFGAAWWLLAPYSGIEHHLLLTFVMGGMCLGAVPLLASSLTGYSLYTASVCLPSIAWMLGRGSESYVIMAVLSLFFFLAVLATARVHHRSLTRMISLAAANDQLREHQDRLRDFADLGADLFWESDAQGRFSYLSDGYQGLTGIPAGDMLGEPLDCTRGPCFVPDASLERSSSGAHQQAFTDHVLSWEPRPGSTIVMLSSAIPIRDARGRFLGLRGTVRDITKEHGLAQRLSYQASHDSLTELANRREFESRLVALRERSREEGACHALCYLDLDQFKLINDTCGHAAGDALLRQLAGVLRQRLRAQDTLARLGGDEFGVIIEHCTGDDALVVADGIRRTVEGMRFQWERNAFNLTASIGVVSIEPGSASAAEIMMAADAACYAAKDAGRNRVHVYQPEDEVLSRRSGEMQWVARIGRALEEGRLALCAQPIAPTRGAAVHDPHRDPAHFEVLLRMRGEDDALILPNAFLPAAERYNLATRLDLWVLDATLSWLLALPGRLARVQTCCLNLSGHSIGDEGFLQHLLEALHRHQELGPRLCFELTETAAVANLERSIRFMEQLRRLGCRFALDDFGTGLSSFGYLKSLPVDYLKIDGVFVRGMLDDPIDRAMVTSIHEVSRITGKKTIAENVESPRALALLEDLGVDFAQGHLIGMPVPLEDAVRPRKAQVVPIHS